MLHYSGEGTSACAQVRTPFPYLGNGWTDFAEVWYVVRGQLAMQLTQESNSLLLVHRPKGVLLVVKKLHFLDKIKKSLHPNCAYKTPADFL